MPNTINAEAPSTSATEVEVLSDLPTGLELALPGGRWVVVSCRRGRVEIRRRGDIVQRPFVVDLCALHSVATRFAEVVS